jgi:hypothetical protein
MIETMSRKSKIILVVAFASPALVSQAFAETAPPCTGCDTPKELTIREQIKAEREKYDRENAKITARPWDTILGQIKIDKKPPAVQ